MIRADDKVASVLARDERLIEVFVQTSPAFEKLRIGALRKTMAKLVTVEQAARVAGIEPDVLLTRLNRALGEESETAPAAAAHAAPAHAEQSPLPRELLELPASRIVDLDVREDLREGREPFQRILSALRAAPKDSVVRLRAIFEPVPLYSVLARQHWGHFTERLADDDWRVWFFRDESVNAAPPRAISSPDTDSSPTVVRLDVRGLEPPEPMMRTLEALEQLPRGGTLVQVNVRVPELLLPRLEERGFRYEIHDATEGHVHIVIRHRDT